MPDELEVTGGTINLNRSLLYVVALAMAAIGGGTVPSLVLTTEGEQTCQTALTEQQRAVLRCRRVLRRRLSRSANSRAPDAAPASEGAPEPRVDEWGDGPEPDTGAADLDAVLGEDPNENDRQAPP